jgi:hypothetical protein
MKRRKTVLLLFMLVACGAFFALTGKAMGQGCGQSPDFNTFTCCGVDGHPNQDCLGGGDPNRFCLVSFGNCCGEDYTLANTAPDPTCSQIAPVGFSMPDYHSRVFLAGRCGPSGGLRAAETFIALEPRASSSKLVIREKLLLAKEPR